MYGGDGCTVIANISTSTFCFQLLGLNATDEDKLRDGQIWHTLFILVIIPRRRRRGIFLALSMCPLARSDSDIFNFGQISFIS